VTAISLIEQIPKVKLLTGEQYREFVPSPEEEAKFLAFAPEPLESVATLLADTGLRPEECYRLEFVTWVNGRRGTLEVVIIRHMFPRRI